MKPLFKSKAGKITAAVIVVAVILIAAYKFGYPLMFESYTGVTNAPLTYDSSVRLTDAEFDALADSLTYEARYERAMQVTADEKNEFTRRVRVNILMNTPTFQHETEYPHIKYFRDAGIRQYEGPKTCLRCHETINVKTHTGEKHKVNTLDDVLNSVHFKFQRTAPGFTTYGYDGREVDAKGTRPIPVGKIDRACGIPGSFSWTGWANLVASRPDSLHGDTLWRSEGCGACHIGGNYHPATEKMMPVGDVPEETKQGIDCLICHSRTYDMNYRYVIKDKYGMRWNQDRTMRAAMTVGRPTNENCLNCHQHNMGGDVFAHNVSAQHPGFENPRLMHVGAKRANPFSPETDVHYAAGLQCIDCHVPEGHKIPRGNKGTDLVANDLPGVAVACENCHTSAPHTKNVTDRVILNGHVNRVACETCHIKKLEPFNVVLRDWVHPTWDPEEGVYVPTDIYTSGQPGKGFTFLWFNGNGTFLANALGNNPLRKDLAYNPLMNQLAHLDDPEVIKEMMPSIRPLLKKYNLDSAEYVNMFARPLSQLSPDMLAKRKQIIEDKILPLMNMGQSKIYPFKLFNAMMYEDMGNQGPFGAMILPFDYPTYYQTGDSKAAVKKAIATPIIKRMYEEPFKLYMMDEFMHYFGVDEWHTDYPLKDGKLVNVEPHWMRQMGSLMFNHAIEKDGRKCVECHDKNGILDYKALGYPPERVRELQNLPELRTLSIRQ